MKELYLNPEMDVVKFSVEDVIATSTATTAPTVNMGGENEGERDEGGLL
ncbi:MAG: hypothetical protein IJV82_05180 [Oscillospiraceae bacterium]|nr:hypothetical protein [Oscillospiraceae bacterium]